MTKEELVGVVADNLETTKAEGERALAAVLDAITDTLAGGEEVRLANFATFTVKVNEPRTSRNPRTGDAVELGETVRLGFRPGKGLKDAAYDTLIAGTTKKTKKAAPKAKAKAPKAKAKASPAKKAAPKRRLPRKK